MDVSSGKNIYFCPLCWLYYPDKSSFDTHMTSLHDKHGSKKFFCHICPLRFSQLRYLKAHLDRHFETKISVPYDLTEKIVDKNEPRPEWMKNFKVEEICLQNNINIASESYENKNLKKEQVEKPKEMWWEVKEDRLEFVSPSVPDNISVIRYTCVKCNKEYKDRTNASRHSLVCSDSPSILCDLCGILQISKTELKRHKKRKHKLPIYTCPKCDEEFDNIPSLISHLKTGHEFDSSLLCEKCGKIYPNKKSLARHSRIHQAKPNKVYVCIVCNKKFVRRDCYRVHVKNHVIKSNKP